jgi:serine/threonine protein kinase
VFAGDFRVVRPLRSGGQGSLYVVEQLSTGRPRALKLMLPELVAQPASRKRFELEARIAARIRSDHVVESIASGVDTDSGTPWLVMELLEGEDLAAYIRRKKRVAPREVLEIFSQLCHALGEAHGQGIVHRDLKPENVFLAEARRRGVPFMVKVLDFGIARILAESTLSSATVSSLGTPLWMAPEQSVPGGAVAPASDVWPLGLLAFRMLTGHLFWKAPYDANPSVVMLMAEAFMHPLPAASARAEHYGDEAFLPPGFDAWFARCVARPMDARFENAAEAFGALEPLLVAFHREDVAALSDRPKPRGADGLPETFDRPSDEPESDSLLLDGPRPLAGAVNESARAPVGVTTGAELRTWAGAPELAASAVVSAEASHDSGPAASNPPDPSLAGSASVAPPAEADAATTTSAGASKTLDPIPSAARPAAKRRWPALLLVAVALGAALGAGAFGVTRRARRATATPPAAVAAPLPSTSPVAPPPQATEPAAPPPASTPASVASAASPAAAGASTAAPGAAEPNGNTKRNAAPVCKAAGGKCFANDDCCDRVCRRWVCRPNAAFHDPYAGDGK